MDIIKLSSPPSLLECACVVGKKEYNGPLRGDFDIHGDDDRFLGKTWEESESEMQRYSLNLALAKAKLDPGSLKALFAGDLMNQCTGSVYGLESFELPYFGIYGACSTFAEGLIISSMMINAGYYDTCAVVSSSHFCTAERQFRFPLEYGGQRAPTAQRTCTAAGAAIVSSSGTGPYVTEVLPGRIVDKGIKDLNNMGAAMAPAAVDTLERYFEQSGNKPSDFDMILTGDLGAEGHGIVSDFVRIKYPDIIKVFNDCGLLMYGRMNQDVHAGGSGCGCSAAVITGHIFKKFRRGEIGNILYIATGALMSPVRTSQGCSIPGIAHLVRISASQA